MSSQIHGVVTIERADSGLGEMSLTVISQTAVPFTSSLSFSPSFDGPFMHKPNVGAGSTPFLIAASPADVSLLESQGLEIFEIKYT